MRGLAIIAFALAVGCGEGAKAPGPGEPAPEAPAASAASADFAGVLTRLGGAAPFEITAARPYAALGCMRGEVEGLDVLVCRYADEAKAEAAQASLREFVAGALSGIVRKSGSELIAIADRKEVDPKGERISRLVKGFAATP